MTEALCMLGISAIPFPVYASRDSDVRTIEQDYVDKRPVFLFLDFYDPSVDSDPLAHPFWNQFEGVCQPGAAAALDNMAVYALWPSQWADTPLHMLNKVLAPTIKQYWVYLKGVVTKADLDQLHFPLTEWTFDGIVNTTPVELPGD